MPFGGGGGPMGGIMAAGGGGGPFVGPVDGGGGPSSSVEPGDGVGGCGGGPATFHCPSNFGNSMRTSVVTLIIVVATELAGRPGCSGALELKGSNQGIVQYNTTG